MNQRGVALPLTLWSIALLALIGTHLTANSRADMRIAAAMRLFLSTYIRPLVTAQVGDRWVVGQFEVSRRPDI